MADITMCINSCECPLAPDCYRAEESGTKPDERIQSYMFCDCTENDAGVPHCDSFLLDPRLTKSLS